MKQETQIKDLAPVDWFNSKDSSSIWITAYRIMLANKEQLAVSHLFDFEKLRILVFYGNLKYLDVSQIRAEINNDGNIKIDGEFIKSRDTGEGAWLLLIQPYVIDGVEQREYEIKARAGFYAALYAAINGRNMAFDRIFDNIVALSDGKQTASSPTFINPNAFPRPDLSKEKLRLIHQAGKQIETKEQKDRKRVELSLHWFEKGLRSKGLDGFVNYWVAIETLGMPDTTNVRPLNESLARAYNMTVQDTTSEFGVGKIFGLRSRILHNGEDLPIHQELSAYMEYLYADILFDHLGLPSERKALTILANPAFNLDKLVYIAAK